MVCCYNCQCWVKCEDQKGELNKDNMLGHCHKHAPMHTNQNVFNYCSVCKVKYTTEAVWPLTLGADCCNEGIFQGRVAYPQGD